MAFNREVRIFPLFDFLFYQITLSASPLIYGTALLMKYKNKLRYSITDLEAAHKSGKQSCLKQSLLNFMNDYLRKENLRLNETISLCFILNSKELVSDLEFCILNYLKHNVM